MNETGIANIVASFLPNNGEETIKIEAIEGGLINRTFRIDHRSSSYILQQINTKVFQDPEGIQSNIGLIENHLKERSYPKAALSMLRTLNGELLTQVDKAVWRMFHYIPNSSCYHVVPSVNHAYESAKALGEFHQYVSDFDPRLLKTPIKGFLDFEQRQHHFEKALTNGNQERLSRAQESIAFIQKNRNILDDYQKTAGLLPKRVIHGDPKISNFLFQQNSTEVICMIDWDTIMQGSILYDFGDMVRSFTNRAEENITTLDARFDGTIFEAIKEGYLVHQRKALTTLELDNVELGAKAVIYVQAMRFLTDYLLGDIYYGTSYSEQNLDRTKNQVELLKGFMSYKA